LHKEAASLPSAVLLVDAEIFFFFSACETASLAVGGTRAAENFRMNPSGAAISILQ